MAMSLMREPAAAAEPADGQQRQQREKVERESAAHVKPQKGLTLSQIRLNQPFFWLSVIVPWETNWMEASAIL